MVRTRPPTADQKAGSWDDVRKEAERAARRSGAMLAKRLERVFVEHAYVLRVHWDADMAEKLLEDLLVINTQSVRDVFAQHLERWRHNEAQQAAEQEVADG